MAQAPLSPVQTTRDSCRRADIDGLRVAAMVVLIVYHVLLVFNAHDWWRVRSSNAGEWVSYVVAAVTPWRMALVFFIGGVAARFMLDKMSALQFTKDRIVKLLTAFVFALIVLVPLQRYVRINEEGGPRTHDYLDYLLHEAAFVRPFHGVWLPDFAHAWFLPYLLAYSIALVAIFKFAPKLWTGAKRKLENTPLVLLALGLTAWLALVDVAIVPSHPISNLFFTDYAAHFRFFPIFILGALLAKNQRFRLGVAKGRWLFWGVSAALLTLCLGLQWALENDLIPSSLLFGVRGVFGAMMMFSAFAFGEVALNKPSALLTYATDAILPVYLMHQTVLVVSADAITPLHLPFALEFPALLTITALLPLAIYHVAIRKTPPLRFLFGLRPTPRNSPKPTHVRQEGTEDLTSRARS